MADDGGARPPKMPLWVKVFIGIGAAVLLLIVGVAAFGGGEHGPGRHFGGEDDSASGTPTSTMDHSGTHAPPPEAGPNAIPHAVRAT